LFESNCRTTWTTKTVSKKKECVTVEVYDMHPGRDANNVTEPRAVGRADPVTGWIKVVKRLSQQQTR